KRNVVLYLPQTRFCIFRQNGVRIILQKRLDTLLGHHRARNVAVRASYLPHLAFGNFQRNPVSKRVRWEKRKPILVTGGSLDQVAGITFEIKRVGDGKFSHRQVLRVGVSRNNRLEKQASDFVVSFADFTRRNDKKLTVASRRDAAHQLLVLIALLPDRN